MAAAMQDGRRATIPLSADGGQTQNSGTPERLGVGGGQTRTYQARVYINDGNEQTQHTQRETEIARSHAGVSDGMERAMLTGDRKSRMQKCQ